MNILEGCRHNKVAHLVYASSSSVYGGNTLMPFSEHHSVDHPISMYAATKKANELMAHTYSHLFGLPTTGLRFLPSMALGPARHGLVPVLKAILEGRPIDVFNHGKMRRDFTYIDDIVQGVVRTMDRIAEPDAGFDPIGPIRPQQRTLPGLQYRQPQPGRTDELRRGHRGFAGLQGAEELPADAGRRRARHLRRYRRPAGLDRLPAGHAGEGRVARFVNWYRDYYKA